MRKHPDEVLTEVVFALQLKSLAADLSRTVLLARASDLAQPLRSRSNL